MIKERRKSANTALRELVNALKMAIAARDGLWSLSVVDRLFRPAKYRKTIAEYDDAMQAVRNALQGIVAETVQKQGKDALRKEFEDNACITQEELDFLLAQPGRGKMNGAKRNEDQKDPA